jgi:uncharacterized protein YecE (DUF72 family)
MSRRRKRGPKVWIGTSGWVYKHWKNGVFYPEKFSADQQLAFYASRFQTVEVNYSFYRLPDRDVFEGWRNQTPREFLFAVKGSRYLTHMKKLQDPEEPLERLMEHAGGLREKLGPILFQFPHTWPVHLERLEPFVRLLKSYRNQRFAFEFRHQSWLTKEVYELLESTDAALCLPITPGMPLDVRLTASWSYIRFHHGSRGIGFGKKELSLWGERILSFLKEGADVFAYFNNDARGYAVRDAQRLGKMLVK